MTRRYTSEIPDTLSLQGAKSLRSKILKFWHSRGHTNVEVNIREITDTSRSHTSAETPVVYYVLASNIVSLGLLSGKNFH